MPWDNNVPAFFAGLMSNLFLSNGYGLPTFTRATTASVTDFEGLLRTAKSGEARFEGARRVENTLLRSENFSVSTWGKTNATATLATIACPPGISSCYLLDLTADPGPGANGSRVYQSATVVSGQLYVFSFWARSVSGTGTFPAAYFNGVEYEKTLVNLTESWQRFSIVFTSVAAAQIVGFSRRGTTTGETLGTAYVTGCQLESVFGQANQNPSEYVSTNVLSAPYHGANVDGVKYFTTQNGNTVASNVVTEATGAAIPDATLHGYLSEGARTNLYLQSNSFSTTWLSTYTMAQDVIGPDGLLSAWTLTDSDALATKTLTQEVAMTSGTKVTHSIFIKKQASPPANGYPAFYVLNTAVTRRSGVTIDPVNGIATPWTAYPGFTILSCTALCEDFSADWWRVSFTYTPDTTENYKTYFVAAGKATATDAINTVVSAFTGTQIVFGAQLEAGAFASSYIPTTTASVTRNADSLTYPTAGNISNTLGSASMDVRLNTASQQLNNAVLGSLTLYINLASRFRIYDGTNSANPAAFADNILTKVAESWGNSNMSLVYNGGSVSKSSFDGTLFDTFSGGIKLLSPAFGTIRNVKIWKKALTDAKLIELTR